MRKFRVCVWLNNTLTSLGKLDSLLENPRLFNITLEDGQKANEATFRSILLQKKPDLLDNPSKPKDPAQASRGYFPNSTMKILSWSLIEE